MTLNPEKKYLALCGGVGGAKLALGLSHVLNPDQLTIVVNTGDDFEHLGLTICPDIDTVTYTLAGLVETAQGWGRAEETWNALEQVNSLDGESWFRLGDKDLGLHLVRRAMLDAGKTLSEVTAHISNTFGIEHAVVPMSDDPVRTLVDTEEGVLSFQHYFVREQCRPRVSGIKFTGTQSAKPSPIFFNSLSDDNLAGVIICPSNPFLSIDPILSLPGIRNSLENCHAPVIAVSPVVGGTAIKGPTAKIMQELSLAVTQQAIVDHYAGLIDGLVIDNCDSEISNELEDTIAINCCETVMKNLDDKLQLAENCLAFIDSTGNVNA